MGDGAHFRHPRWEVAG